MITGPGRPAHGNSPPGTGNFQAFVASERNNPWRSAIEVPGLRTLNRGGNAFVNSVSCASAGNCAAGGDYKDSSGNRQAFVASQN